MSDYAADLTNAMFTASDALRDGRDPEEAVRDCLRPQGLTWADREIARRAIASARRDLARLPHAMAAVDAFAAALEAAPSPLTEMVNAELAAQKAPTVSLSRAMGGGDDLFRTLVDICRPVAR